MVKYALVLIHNINGTKWRTKYNLRRDGRRRIDWRGGRVLILLRGQTVGFIHLAVIDFVLQFRGLVPCRVTNRRKRIIGDHLLLSLLLVVCFCVKSFLHSVWNNAIRSICNMCGDGDWRRHYHQLLLSRVKVHRRSGTGLSQLGLGGVSEWVSFVSFSLFSA